MPLGIAKLLKSGKRIVHSIFVAGGSSGNMATTTNGLTWTKRVSAFGLQNVNDLTVGGDIIIAVGTNGVMNSSSSGKAWTSVTNPFGNTNTTIWNAAYGDGRFIAVGDNGIAATSTDGKAWTSIDVGLGARTLRTITHGGGMFLVAGGLIVPNQKVSISSDGVNWSQVTIPGHTQAINVAIKGNLWVIAGQAASLWTSPDGQNWTQRTVPGTTSSTNFLGAAWSGSIYVVSDNLGNIYTSSDAVTWSKNNLVNYPIWGIDYGVDDSGTSFFTAVGDNGSVIWKSTNGTSWQAIPSGLPASISLRAVVFRKGG